MEPDNPPKSTLAVVASVVWGVMLLPGLLGAALSPMMFDAPGSTSNPAAYVNVAIVLSFPLLCLVSIAGSWIVWQMRKGRPTRGLARAQAVVFCLPLVPVAIVVATMAIDTIGVLASGQPMGLHSTIIRN
jgi:hypothetical protein